MKRLNKGGAAMTRTALFMVTALWLLSAQVFAQEAEEMVVQQEGNRLVLKHDVAAIDATKEVVVTLTLRGKLPSGDSPQPGVDRGKEVTVGKERKIYWTVETDFPTGYVGKVDWQVVSTDKTGVRKKWEGDLMIPLPTF
jgi:hypothetical protein